MSERKLAKIVKIDAVTPIEGADAIECAKVGGWSVVVKKGEFQENSLATYFEIDSWLPESLAPFLYDGKEYNGVPGARLRTVKLRGQISQGLLLPRHVVLDKVGEIYEGMDVTELLGIQKWECPMPEQLQGLAKGNFPSFIPKTDQERVQNLTKEVASMQGEMFEATIKLDGSSITVFSRKTEEGWVDGVCSRNLELKEDDNNAFWKVAKENDIHAKLKSFGRSLAIQGEMLSPSIQGNWEKVDKLCMFVYDVFDIDNQVYFKPEERLMLCKHLDLPHVPVLDKQFVLQHDVQSLLDFAEGEGMNKGVKREGIVFKHHNSDFSMKAISNSYLLKNKNA